MPKVGMKSFSYDEAGVKKANEEAMKTGLPIEYENRPISKKVEWFAVAERLLAVSSTRRVNNALYFV
jgi:hypothetical protein